MHKGAAPLGLFRVYGNVQPVPSTEGTMSDTEQTTEAQTPPPTSGAKDGPPATEDKRFTQAELDAIVRDRLDRERKKADESQRKAAEEAEAKKLAEQQEWQKLASQHEARVKELEPQAEQAARYEAALKAHLETQRNGLPAHLVELLDQMDVAAQLEWIAKHQDVIHPDAPAENGTKGVPPTPKAAPAPGREQVVQEKVDTLRKTGTYGRF
jgi:hypothetical protein